MDNMSILEYYTENVTPEQARLVNTVYSCDYIKTLMDLGLNGRKGLTMDAISDIKDKVDMELSEDEIVEEN